MTTGARLMACVLGLAIATPAAPARAEGPIDLQSAFARAFDGVTACVAVRDVAPGSGAAISDQKACERRRPPCATFELPATVIAIDRGVVPDANTPVKRNPAVQGDPPEGVNLRDAFRRPVGWVYEEISRRVGSDAFARSLSAMRYGNAETRGPVERLGRGDEDDGLTLSAVEQVEFLAKLRRGELPSSAESQARAVELMPVERAGDAAIGLKSGACDGAAWAVGWVERAQRNVIFATLVMGENPSVEDAVARTRKLLVELSLVPPPQPPK